LEDGQALRLQAGVRFGDVWMAPGNMLWVTTVGAFLYSDVWVEGFSFVSTSGGLVSPVDEGKLRALGEFTTKLAMKDGTSYFLQTQVRGGEDLIGVAGQLGIRYEW
jgi:hypothetical protein